MKAPLFNKTKKQVPPKQPEVIQGHVAHYIDYKAKRYHYITLGASICSFAIIGSFFVFGSFAAAPTPSSTPAPEMVSGIVTPAIVTTNQSRIAQTDYFLNGKVIQSSKGAVPFETTKLANGTYTIQTVTTLKDGSTLTETQTMTIKN